MSRNDIVLYSLKNIISVKQVIIKDHVRSTDLDPSLPRHWQVDDNVIRPCEICWRQCNPLANVILADKF